MNGEQGLPIGFYIPMQRKHWRTIVSIICLPILLLVLPLGAKEQITDEEKRSRVYAMYAEYKQSFPDVRDITPSEVKKLMRTTQVQFVDTRRPEERAVSILPGAISQEEFLKAPARYADATVIAYCTISYRSGLFAAEVSEKDVKVFNLAGGLLAWVLEGGKVVNDNGETRQIHVYGDEWNYPPRGYEAVQYNFLERLFH